MVPESTIHKRKQSIESENTSYKKAHIDSNTTLGILLDLESYLVSNDLAEYTAKVNEGMEALDQVITRAKLDFTNDLPTNKIN